MLGTRTPAAPGEARGGDRPTGGFERPMRPPFAVDGDAVEASYEHAVPGVRMAEPEGPRSRVRRVPITRRAG
jgi:hypothetical protein